MEFFPESVSGPHPSHFSLLPAAPLPPCPAPQDAQERLDAFCHVPMDCRQLVWRVYEVQRVGRTHRRAAAQQVRGSGSAGGMRGRGACWTS